MKRKFSRVVIKKSTLDAIFAHMAELQTTIDFQELIYQHDMAEVEHELTVADIRYGDLLSENKKLSREVMSHRIFIAELRSLVNDDDGPIFIEAPSEARPADLPF